MGAGDVDCFIHNSKNSQFFPVNIRFCDIKWTLKIWKVQSLNKADYHCLRAYIKLKKITEHVETFLLCCSKGIAQLQLTALRRLFHSTDTDCNSIRSCSTWTFPERSDLEVSSVIDFVIKTFPSSNPDSVSLSRFDRPTKPALFGFPFSSFKSNARKSHRFGRAEMLDRLRE